MIGANDAEIFAFMTVAYLIAPILLAKYLCRASWLQVALAFPVFYLVLFLVLGFGRLDEEVFGWTLIAAMFVSWLGVPITALALKLSKLPQRLLSTR